MISEVFDIRQDLDDDYTEADRDRAVDECLQKVLAERTSFARTMLLNGSVEDIRQALDAVAEVERRISISQSVRDSRDRTRAELMDRLQGNRPSVLSPFKELAAEATTRGWMARLGKGDKVMGVILTITGISGLTAFALCVDLVLQALHVSL